jgi:acyl-CoA reductase-like NAD-dependent aldehyde dehydrogenase
LITSPVIRKVNFTGSTAVGREIASKAGANLKPVLLELGGKNCAIILDDADLERAAWAVVEGATLNVRSVAQVEVKALTSLQNGQICMSTDTVLVVKSVAASFRRLLRTNIERKQNEAFHVINEQSQERIKKLLKDAVSKGAEVSPRITENHAGRVGDIPLALIEDIEETMDMYSTESFGPVLSLKVVENIEEAINVANHSGYGLSAAIWTKSHHEAISIGHRLEVGAVHVNGMTVHDEATLPHGGSGLSGFGRFGGSWGLREFVQTQTVVLNV